jgi:hypothetical protein
MPHLLFIKFKYILFIWITAHVIKILLFKEVLKMDEMIFNKLQELQDEKKRLEESSVDTGFMDTSRYPNAVSPFRIPFRPYQICQMTLDDSIRANVTGQELLILCRTTYRSPKEQIEKYIEIIQRLLEAGIFDIPEMNNDSEEQIELPNPFKKDSKDSIDVKTALKIADDAKMAIITAEQKKD